MLLFPCGRKVFALGLASLSLLLFLGYALELLALPHLGKNSSGTDAYSSAHTRLNARIENRQMASNRKKKKQMVKKEPLLRIEQLEPRQMFSVAPNSAPPIEHMLAAPPIEHMQEPVLGASEAAPPLTSPWMPLVYAGADLSISQNETANLSGEAIVNLPLFTSVNWNLLSGPGDVTFGNSTTTVTTAQFSEAGTYELELMVTNNGIAASDRVMVNVVAIDAININQAWLDAQGDGPYYLDQQGKTYVLQTDVTTDGTAFAIIADDVRFDLNGHTITYNNAAPIEIPNGSFEQGTAGDASGWDFSDAPNAERYSGNWLHNEVYDGEYSLRFNNTTTDQHVVSTSTITLEANTTYSLSGMFEYGGQGNDSNPGVNGYVRLVGTGGEPTREVSNKGKMVRGIQFTEATFTTGALAETYSIQVGTEGHASSTEPYFIDDIKVQRHKTYGVAVAPPGDWAQANWPDITHWAAAENATIRNGTITQGQDGATWGHAINYRDDGLKVEGLNITIHGANASAMWTNGSYSVQFLNNTITSNTTTITSRDELDGAVIKNAAGIIANNTIDGGPGVGIKAVGTGTEIYGNTIALKGRYTNNFAIIGGTSSVIHNNTINSHTGEYSSRGIAPGSGTEGNLTLVYDNIVNVQQLANNQEYEGAPSGGAYALQVEGAGYVEIYGNELTSYGTTLGYALRFTDAPTNVNIHNNTLRAISGLDGYASALSFQYTGDTEIILENNRIITNDGIFAGGDARGIILKGTTIEVVDAVGDPIVFAVDYGAPAGIHTTVRFRDTIFADSASEDHFGNGVTRTLPQYGGGINSTRIQVYLDWTTTISVTNNGLAASGASIVVEDINTNQVYLSTTDANGKVETVLVEYVVQGDTKTTYNDYTAKATLNGQETTTQFTADNVQTLNLVIVATQQSMQEGFTEYVAYGLSPQSSSNQSFAAYTLSTVASVEPVTNIAVENEQRNRNLESVSMEDTQSQSSEPLVDKEAEIPGRAVDEAITEISEFEVATKLLSLF